MAAITKRVLFGDYQDGCLVIHDFAVVTANGRSMVEPRYSRDLSSTRIDQVDEINRVDEIKIIDRSQRNVFINFGETIVMHGEGIGAIG